MDLRGDDLVAVIKYLPPLAHLTVGHRDDGKVALVNAHLRRVARQHGEILWILADELERERVALELQKRLDT